MSPWRHSKFLLNDVKEEIRAVVFRDGVPDKLRLFTDASQFLDYLIRCLLIKRYSNISQLLKCSETNDLLILSPDKIL